MSYGVSHGSSRSCIQMKKLILQRWQNNERKMQGTIIQRYSTQKRKERERMREKYNFEYFVFYKYGVMQYFFQDVQVSLSIQ